MTLEIALGDKLGPGEYEVSIVYYCKSKELIKDAPADLVSNVVKIKVGKQP